MKNAIQIDSCAFSRAGLVGVLVEGDRVTLLKESGAAYEVTCFAPDLAKLANAAELLALGNGAVDPGRVSVVRRQKELLLVTFDTHQSTTLECNSEEDAREALSNLGAAMERLGPRYTEIAHLTRAERYPSRQLFMVVRVSVGDNRGQRSEAAVEPEGVYFTREEAESWIESRDGGRREMCDGEESATVFNILVVRSEGTLSEIVERMTVRQPSDGVPF